MNVADYVVSFLSALGVKHIFGYAGSPLIPLLAALERQSDVQWVLMRHENSAALCRIGPGQTYWPLERVRRYLRPRSY